MQCLGHTSHGCRTSRCLKLTCPSLSEYDIRSSPTADRACTEFQVAWADIVSLQSLLTVKKAYSKLLMFMYDYAIKKCECIMHVNVTEKCLFDDNQGC